MQYSEYQKFVSQSVDPKLDLTQRIMLAGFGLSGEAGEVNDIIKKFYFHGKDFALNDLKLELGDVLWYLTLYCNCYGLSLEDVMKANKEKLEKRYPERKVGG